MADKMTAEQVDALADHTAQMIITAAQAAHPGDPRKAAACAIYAAACLPGEYVAATGVHIGRLGPHAGDDSHQAALDYEIWEQ